MNNFDRELRLFIYQHIIDTSEVPSVAALARGLNCAVAEIELSHKRMAAEHILVLKPNSVEILMAMPFSAVPTAFIVRHGEQQWWANCIWDALGIAPMLNADIEIETSCADCETELRLNVEAGQLLLRDGMIHFAVLAKDWWRDIAYT